MMLQRGDKAPDFDLEDGNGKRWKLSDLAGQRLVGAHLLLLVPVYVLLLWRFDSYRGLLWLPFLRSISREWMKLKAAEGRFVRGHKIGLTSRAMQISSQIDEPDYGHLLSDMAVGGSSVAGEETVSAGRYCYPRVEVEVAFVDRLRGIKRDVIVRKVQKLRRSGKW